PCGTGRIVWDGGDREADILPRERPRGLARGDGPIGVARSSHIRSLLRGGGSTGSACLRDRPYSSATGPGKGLADPSLNVPPGTAGPPRPEVSGGPPATSGAPPPGGAARPRARGRRAGGRPGPWPRRRGRPRRAGG